MRGVTNLQRQFQVLARGTGSRCLRRDAFRRHTAGSRHADLGGVASYERVDVDRVSFAPFCFGSSLPPSLLIELIEHARPSGT